MKRLIVLCVIAVLAACAVEKPIERTTPSPVSVTAPWTAPPGAIPKSAAPLAAIGQEAADQINAWYSRADLDCGGATLPAFLCSGVMLRATETNPAFLPWDPSPGSVSRGGVSFSWLRTDTNFANLVFAYRNGFIFYPQQATPPGKSTIQVLCVFPMDADTGNRPTLQGCGPNTAYPAPSKPCESQAITTAPQWLAHFNQQANKYSGQCGWSVRYGEPGTADRFYQSILARKGMASAWWSIQNEVMLATWAPGQGATLPIRAFFYVPGSAGALEKAQDDQARFHASYGSDMPIIRVTLPTSASGKAAFAYSDADQGGGTGQPGSSIDFESTPVQGPSEAIEGPGFHLNVQGAQGGKVSIENGSSPGGNIGGHHLVLPYAQGSGVAVLFYPDKQSVHVSIGFSKEKASPFMYFYCYSEGGASRAETGGKLEGVATCDGVDGKAVYSIALGSNAESGTVRIDNIDIN